MRGALLLVFLVAAGGCTWLQGAAAGCRRAATVRVTLPEGADSFEMAAQLEAAGVVAGADFLERVEAPLSSLPCAVFPHPAKTAEGFLFPDTYEFYQPSQAGRVFERILKAFCDKALPVWNAAPASLRRRFEAVADLQSPLHAWVTLASVVQAEAGPGEAARVAGVFANRLWRLEFSPRRLQADATVGYGLRRAAAARLQPPGPKRAPTPDEIRDPANPYNTYRHAGLPPGPITNPGLAALAAALRPESHRYLYFVRQSGRGHAFAETLEGHRANVAAWRRSQAR